MTGAAPRNPFLNNRTTKVTEEETTTETELTPIKNNTDNSRSSTPKAAAKQPTVYEQPQQPKMMSTQQSKMMAAQQPKMMAAQQPKMMVAQQPKMMGNSNYEQPHQYYEQPPKYEQQQPSYVQPEFTQPERAEYSQTVRDSMQYPSYAQQPNYAQAEFVQPEQAQYAQNN